MKVIFVLLFVGLISAEGDDDFLPKSHCTQAQDCYIIPGELELACYYDVNKCKCQTTINSIYRVDFQNGQCQMSKFGPCGIKGNLKVSCLDGFTCVNGRCLDPNETTNSKIKGKEEAFEFDRSCDPDGAGSCQFTENLPLKCGNNGKCICDRILPADARSPVWDFRNFDGDKNCSVGQFGPCGNKDGIKIDCHGDGLSCVSGKCLNAKQPFSTEDQPCGETTDCKSGLICAQKRKCIKPNSAGVGETCKTKEECNEGLICFRNPEFGPWGPAFCTDPKTVKSSN